MIMKSMKQIKNGSLYVNTRDKNTTRVLGRLNSQRVITKRHQDSIDDVQIKNLRLAEGPEVAAYLDESVAAL